MQSPITAFIALFTLIITAFASPVAVEKRSSRSGRVRLSLLRVSHSACTYALGRIQGTWFEVGLGACGDTSVDSDKIIAISSNIYGDGTYCDKTVSITANGKTATATVKDECPSCGSGDIGTSCSPCCSTIGADGSVPVRLEPLALRRVRRP